MLAKYKTAVVISNVFVILFWLLSVQSQAQNCDSSVANKFITKLFHDKSYKPYDDIKFVSFSPDRTKSLDLPVLKKMLPKYCFYYTEFISNQYEYLNVETAIALQVDQPDQLFIIHSPLFGDKNENFIRLFYGLKIQDSIMKINLCKEVMKIFSSITYQGHINPLLNLKDKNSISFELLHDNVLHNNQSLGVYDFIFDANCLTKIILRKLGIDEIKSDYKQL